MLTALTARQVRRVYLFFVPLLTMSNATDVCREDLVLPHATPPTPLSLDLVPGSPDFMYLAGALTE